MMMLFLVCRHVAFEQSAVGAAVTVVDRPPTLMQLYMLWQTAWV